MRRGVRVDVENGKYTFISWDNGSVDILRYGCEWVVGLLTGSKALIALIHEHAELKHRMEGLEK